MFRRDLILQYPKAFTKISNINAHNIMDCTQSVHNSISCICQGNVGKRKLFDLHNII